MADISITDQVSLSANVKVKDDAPLALASLKSIKFQNLPVVGDFTKPVDQFSLAEVELGLGLTEPAALIGRDAGILLGGGVSGKLFLRTHQDGNLFDDEFSPAVSIAAGECWLGLSIDFELKESANLLSTGFTFGTPTAPPEGFGVSLSSEQSVALGTFVHFSGALPSFKDALVTLIESYSLAATGAKLRAALPGMAHTSELAGQISLGASYSAPLIVNPLATLSTLNFSLYVQPNVGATISGSLTLAGSFIVRAYRSSGTKLVLGVFRKKETSVSVSFLGEAGIGIDSNTTDVLAKVLNTVIPAADLNNLNLDDSQKKELRTALKECIDHSISLAVNDCFTSSKTDEAALVYEIDLSVGDSGRTDAAIAAAINGDWSGFAKLSNARCVRNVVETLRERKHKLSINLLGIYNAAHIEDYLNSTTVVHDENGQIVVIDKVQANSISVGTTPYAVQTEKLRSALAESFVATVTYGAGKSKLGVTAFTVRQSFLEYKARALPPDIAQEILLAKALKLSLPSQWDALISSSQVFNRNKFYVDVSYDAGCVMRLFYQDVAKRIPHPASVLERIGRETRIALLDPSATNWAERQVALSRDDIWNEMTAAGDTNAFRLIPQLASFNLNAIQAIGADYLDIRWWSNAMQRVTPKLTALLVAIQNSRGGDALHDTAFAAAQKDLKSALISVSKTSSAFGDGWPVAVMYAVAASSAGAAPIVEMDIGWNERVEHYSSDATMAAGQTSGH